MENLEKLSISYFEDKWYVREDLYPEPFDTKRRHVENCRIMHSVGNCFYSKEDAMDKCNAIRTLVGARLIK